MKWLTQRPQVDRIACPWLIQRFVDANALSRAELTAFSILAGLMALVIKAPPRWLPKLVRTTHVWLPGASLAAIGIFLPVFIPVAVLSAWFKRHRDNAQLKAFVQGATGAATGAITGLGSVVILGQRAIFDVPTAAIGRLVSLGVLWRFNVQEPTLVVAAGLAGLAAWSLAHAGE